MVDVMSEAAAVELCRVNIGPGQRARRLWFGIAGFAAAAVLAVTLLAMHAPRLARLTVAAPLLLGAFGYFQAREKT